MTDFRRLLKIARILRNYCGFDIETVMFHLRQTKAFWEYVRLLEGE